MLLVFRDKKGKKINLPKQIGMGYKRIGILLLQDSTGERVKALEQQHNRVAEDINLAILNEWVTGNGIEPVTWGTLSDVLANAGFSALSVMIKEVFQ